MIVCANVKGGVGKTTTAVQLALWAGHRGHRTLLVDADPGRSALSWCMRAGDAWPETVPTIAYPQPDLPRRLPALARDYDAVVVDTPHDPNDGTQVGPVLAGALAVAELLVIPTSPAPADLDRLGDLLAAVHREEARRELSWMIALVKVDLRRRALATGVGEDLTERDLPIGETWVPLRASVADAFGTAELLVEYDALASEVLAAAFAEVPA
ncbi:MAG TPA: ParA family protein [Acidimicrobiales bacterium]|nr:ParA family protein [Acidimicrobiales bacterium]